MEDRNHSLEKWIQCFEDRIQSLEDWIACPVKPEAKGVNRERKGVDQAPKGVNRNPKGVAEISSCAIRIRVPVAEEAYPVALHRKTVGRIRCAVPEKLSPGMMS